MSWGNAAYLNTRISLASVLNFYPIIFQGWVCSFWVPLPMLFYLQSTEFYFWSCYIVILSWECVLEFYLIWCNLICGKKDIECGVNYWQHRRRQYYECNRPNTLHRLFVLATKEEEERTKDDRKMTKDDRKEWRRSEARESKAQHVEEQEREILRV